MNKKPAFRFHELTESERHATRSIRRHTILSLLPLLAAALMIAAPVMGHGVSSKNVHESEQNPAVNSTITKWHTAESLYQQVDELLLSAEDQYIVDDYITALSLLERATTFHQKYETQIRWADILQKLHDFDAAITHLDKAILLRPESQNAALIKSSVHASMGQPDKALEACKAKSLRDYFMHRMTCIYSVESTTGKLLPSYLALKRIQVPETTSDQALLAWQLDILAEMAERLNRPSEAERYLRSKIATNHDYHSRFQLVDFYLREERHLDALNSYRLWLDESNRARLRLAVLCSREASNSLCRDNRDVIDEMTNASLNSLALSDYERQLFSYYLSSREATAMQIAAENWQTEKSPATLYWIKRVARETGNHRYTELSERWINRHDYQDLRLTTPTTSTPASQAQSVP